MATDTVRIRPRERRGDRTRARLVEAALEEFRREGIERASIARIARAAGVSRPTFYFHFPNKEDLLREVLGGFELEVAERVRRAPTLRAALDELIDDIMDVQAQVGEAVFAEMLRVQTRLSPEEGDASTVVLDAFTPLFRASAERGELRERLDPEHAAAMCMASLFGCLLDTERTGRAEGLRTLVSLFFRDARPEAGS